MLAVSNVYKSYGKQHALINCSFTLDQEEVLGVLANGSGKSTLIKMICGLLCVDKGEIVKKDDVGESLVARQIGVVMETQGLFNRLTVKGNLQFYCYLRQVPLQEIDRVVEVCQIGTYMSKKISKLSLGMKQRVSWAISLLGDPILLILDEPTNGLDPTGIINLRNIIVKQKSEGKAIIIASHSLWEIQKICDKILLLNQGETLFYGAKSELLKKYSSVEDGYLHLTS